MSPAWQGDPDIAKVVPIVARAAELVMAIYQTPFEVELKGPNDPVTRADREANALITRELALAFPGDGIVAEESVPADPLELRRALEHPRVFFVDPVDGTKEFAARNGEFAVMIGLAVDGVATVGVLGVPVTGEIYVGRRGAFAARIDRAGTSPLRVSDVARIGEARATVSRSHPSARVSRILARAGVGDVAPCGSAGLKVAMVARAAADIYVHPTRGGQLWDTCGPEAILAGAGGRMTDAAGNAIDYRGALALDRGILATNGALHDAILAACLADAEAAPEQRA